MHGGFSFRDRLGLLVGRPARGELRRCPTNTSRLLPPAWNRVYDWIGSGFLVPLIGLLLAHFVVPGIAEAQAIPAAPARDLDELRLRVRLGDTVFVRSNTGDLLKGTLREIDRDQEVVVIEGGGQGPLRLPASRIHEIQRQVSDSSWNGALKGAGIALGIGMFMAAISDDAEYGYVFYPPILGFAAGAAIDMAVKERELVYRGLNAPFSLSIGPRMSMPKGGFGLGATFVW